MLFKILEKPELKKLVENLQRISTIIGPKQVDTGRDSKPIYHFVEVDSFDEIDLSYDTTEFSAKTFFLPYKECLCNFKFEGKGWTQEIEYDAKPTALIGLHACDIHGLQKLDKVLAKDTFPSPYYLSRRQNTFVIGIDHEPCEHGFCRSVDADTASNGFDLFLTDLGEEYFVAVGSDRGYGALQNVNSRDITEEDTARYREVHSQISQTEMKEVDTNNLPTVLDIEFDSHVWDKWGDKCLSCGTCAMVCPTCYCYGVNEEVAMDFSESAKVMQLYSCNLLNFATVTGNHNFRPDQKTRLKYRYYHQHRGFVEAYDEPKCVGCNRCGQACPAGITPPDVIDSLIEES